MSSAPLSGLLPRVELDRGAVLHGVRASARRAALPAALLAAVLAFALLAGGPMDALADALRRALAADAGWMVAALGFEMLSFAGYAVLLAHVAGRDGAPRFDLRASLQVSLAGAAATRLLPTAGMGGAALTLWTLRRAGHRGRHGVRILLTFLVLLYAVFLGAIVIAGALVALDAAGGGGAGRVALGLTPAVLAATAIAVALWLGWGARRAGAPAPMVGDTRMDRLRGRARDAAAVLPEAIRGAAALLRHPDARLLGAPAWWAFDVAVLWASFNAFGAPPELHALVLAYFVGQVANTVPLPGAVSGGTVGVLLALGVPADLALASVLAYRAIAIWVPGTAGTAALPALRGTVARWDGDAPAAPLALSGSAS